MSPASVHVTIVRKVIGGAIVLAVASIVAGVLLLNGSRPSPPPQHPAVPPSLARTFAAFPIDHADVWSRPVCIIAQSFNGGLVQVQDLAAALPAGITPEALSTFAASATSALYRTPAEDPSVHVHVLDVPQAKVSTTADEIMSKVVSGAGAGAERSVVRTPSGDGGNAAYEGTRVQTATTDAFVLANAARDMVVLIFSPRITGRDLAARLAASVGNGAGLIDNADARRMIYTLPVAPPSGFALVQLMAFNINKMPDQLDVSMRFVFRSEAPKVLQQTRRVMPERVTAAVYTGPNSERIEVLVGDYATDATGWTAWAFWERALGASGGTIVEVNGNGGLKVTTDAGRYVLFRRGRFVAVVHGDTSASDERVLELAAALQV